MRNLVTATLVATLAAASANAAGIPDGACGTGPAGAAAVLALHAYRAGSGVRALQARADRDVGHVAVLGDRGDLVVRRNPLDLERRSVRLTRNLAGGYDVAPLSASVEPPGTPLPVADAAVAVDLPFLFPFFGTSYTRAFVHADGNVTFGAPDNTPGDQGLGRLLSGPPRIAPWLTDLDPARGGSVTARTSPDRVVLQWNGVPGGAQINRNTFSVTLLPSGAIEFAYAELEARQAVAGVSPGSTLAITPADLSGGTPRGSSGALAERFSESEVVDLVSVGRRFYSAHPDEFDQLIVYTTRGMNPVAGTLAFELNLRNEVRGIGLQRLDHGAAWGSAGRLQSLVFMDHVDTYAEVDGFEVLGHEVGHRWLAALRIHEGALLAADGVHWSFFADTDASVLGGNDIESRGGGRFTTVDFARRFSPFDQYAMGLRQPADVPPMLYVSDPDDFRPTRTFRPSSSPEAGVTFTGVARSATIADVIAALGPRVPASGERVSRLAFLLVEDAESPATTDRLAIVERIRERFGSWFADATEGRGAIDSRLAP